MITCAAPFAPGLGHPEAGDLLARVVFAIVDGSLERRFLGPFRDVFAGEA